MGNLFSRNTDPQQSSDDIDAKPDGGRPGYLDVMDSAVTRLSEYWQNTAEFIIDYKKKMIAIKDNSYKEVVQDYLNSSSELLKFFTEVETLLLSARRSQSYIERVIQLQHGVGREEATMSSFDNIIKASKVNVDSCDKLIEMADRMIKQMNDMFDKYTNMQNNSKPAKDHNSAWWKFVNGTSKCLRCFCFLGRALTNLIALFKPKFGEYIKPILSSLSEGLNVGKEKTDKWNSSNRQVIENAVLKNDAWIRMQDLAQHSTAGMGEVRYFISQLVKNYEDSLLTSSTDVANKFITAEQGMKNIQLALNVFLYKIKLLEKKTRDCSNTILQARKAVLK